MKSLAKVLMALALCMVICLPGMAQASWVGPFPGTIESFEGVAPVTPTNGTGVLEWGNNFRIGQGVVTTFATGVTFTAPIFAGGNWNPNGDPFINDFAFNPGVTNGWYTGNVTPAVVPHGTAWAGTWGDYVTPRVLEFTLPAPMLRVGAYVDGALSPVTMKAFDALNNLLDTQTVGVVPVASWNTNWIGIQVSTPIISKVTFASIDFGVDMLTYSSAQVPLPPSVLLLGSGLIGLAGLGWRRRKKTD